MIKMKRLVNIELTPNCSARCAMCPREHVREKGFMSCTTFKDILNQIKKFDNIWEISFSGRGEPTLHPKLSEILSLCSDIPIPTALITTGVAMTKKNIEVCNKNLDFVRLSVSSIDRQTFEKVHCGLDYNQVWSNIESLTDTIPNKIKVHLVGGKTIYDHLEETIKFFHEKNIYNLYIFPLWNRGGDVHTDDDLITRKNFMNKYNLLPIEDEFCIKDRHTFTEYMKHKKSINKNYCFHGDSSIMVRYNGDILGCFQDFGGNHVIGNVDRDDLKDCILRRSYKLGNMDVCKECNSKDVTMI